MVMIVSLAAWIAFLALVAGLCRTARLGEHVAADPANARVRKIADLGGARGRGLQCVARGPAVATNDAVELHREPPLSWKSRCISPAPALGAAGSLADTHGYVICWAPADAPV